MRASLESRYWPKVDKAGPDGCWNWMGARSANGYGHIRSSEDGHRALAAHRLGYEFGRGPIPPGLVIDHLCNNRRCVNPAHLDAVTQGENNRRGTGIAVRSRAKTHCMQGHPYSETNTIRNRFGHRICRICSHDWTQAYFARKRSGLVKPRHRT